MTTKPDRSVVEDFNELKGYVLGTLALGAAVTTFLTQAFHTPMEPTLIGATGVGLFFLTIVYLINRSEKRVLNAMEIRVGETENRVVEAFQTHIGETDSRAVDVRADLNELKELSLENQRSSLRNEMDGEMYRNPSNHDTIIKYAYRYFHELDGDWVQTDKFLAWKAREEQAGRPVYLPPDLWEKIATKAKQEGLQV